MHKFTNRLSQSASPYLLQHAHNPVDWFEWGTEALEKARKEDKPLLVSIGYSSCHWCHVMERESFENEEVAKIMNQFFVCIKVDREERPDIDSIYMDAVQALGVHGGWPLNVFLTPEQKPFFGGTYFSPVAWTQILQNIDKAFAQNRDNIEHTAEELRLHLLRSDVERFIQPSISENLITDIESIYSKLEANFDTVWGGLDKAPKFIMPSVWHWLLRYHHITKNKKALDHVVLTLKKIAMGGIYDQVGGGFSRYSVDGYWFVPHFEKMLYDNAQLLSLYSEAYAITRDESFRTTVYETFEWLTREMTSDDGGFYSALDADSEGVEGKFYCWTKSELENILGSDADLFNSYYSVSSNGNWEHGNNILIRNQEDNEFLRGNNLAPKDWHLKLANLKKALLKARATRVRPGLDDKVITSWNAMMICGLTTAYKVFNDSKFLNAAIRNISFLERELTGKNTFFRSYKNKPSTVHAFLDDYAYLIKAYIELYQCTFDEQWIKKSETLMNFVLSDFYDEKDQYFHYTGKASEKLITSKKEIFDNVIPSSNSVIAGNLFYLGTMLDKPEWEDLSRTMVNNLSTIIKGEPNYMSNWAITWMEIQHGIAQAIMIGTDAKKNRSEFHTHFQPFAVTLGATSTSELALLADKKPLKNIPSPVFICYNKTCQPPVETVKQANELLMNINK